MKLIKNLPSFLTNKFFLAFGFFVVWMLFFDRNDVFTIMERKKELREIEESKAFFAHEIEQNKKFAVDLKTNPAALEKYAREKYLMKKENEDLFLVEPATETK